MPRSCSLNGDGISLSHELKHQHPELRLMLIGRSLGREPPSLWKSDCEVIALRQEGEVGGCGPFMPSSLGAPTAAYFYELLLSPVGERSR